MLTHKRLQCKPKLAEAFKMEEIRSYVSLKIAVFSFSTLIAIGLVQLWISTLEPAQRVVAFRYQVFVFVEFVLAVICRYIWTRTSELWRPSRALLLMVMLSGMARFGMGPLTSTEPHIITFITSLGLAFILILSTLLASSDVILFCARVCSRDKCNIYNLRAWLCIIATIMIIVIQRCVAEDIRITHINIPVPRGASELEGLTIAQLSDIHLGPNVGRAKLSLIVEMTNSLQADIVVITGDLIDSSYDNLQYAVQPLAKLHSKLGVYFVTGNHEYYTGDVDRWLSRLPEYGVKPLVNSRVRILPHLYLAGLEDYQTRKMSYGNHTMDLNAALGGRDRGIPTIVLAHQPYAVLEAIHWSDVFLVLAGHTHAGQFFPISVPVFLIQPLFAGLYQPLPHVHVYVSSGTVYNWMPLRDLHPPEIVLVTLTTV